MKVIPQAKRVPCGIATLGFFKSPEIFAPATKHNTIVTATYICTYTNVLTHDTCAAIKHDGKDRLEIHNLVLCVVNCVVILHNYV